MDERGWGGQMGDLCLQIQQIQMGERWQLQSELQKWLNKRLCGRWQASRLWNSTWNQNILLIYVSLRLHRLQWNQDTKKQACILDFKRLHLEKEHFANPIYSLYLKKWFLWWVICASQQIWNRWIVLSPRLRTFDPSSFCNWFIEADTARVRGRENIWGAGQANSSVTGRGAVRVI